MGKAGENLPQGILVDALHITLIRTGKFTCAGKGEI
jgi:hypothetical protein